MTGTARPVCPVCWAPTQPSSRGNIASHFDSARELCPGSGQPYAIVVRRPWQRTRVTVTERRP